MNLFLTDRDDDPYNNNSTIKLIIDGGKREKVDPRPACVTTCIAKDEMFLDPEVHSKATFYSL